MVNQPTIRNSQRSAEPAQATARQPIRFSLVLAILVATAGCDADQPQTAIAASVGTPPLTFNRDIAPILFARCANCHRPGEAAPFNLLTYDDVAKRLQQIVEVTHSRYMPPWPPESGNLAFRDERRLTDAELATLQAWVTAGASEGDPVDLPPQPQWISGWRLGKPDLVLEMGEAYPITADGFDVFRNFVVPVSLSEDRYVAAFEFRPGNARVVHHADIRVDGSGGSRELDAMDAEPGFDGIFGGAALSPGGVFLGWTPGRVPNPPERKVAWPLRDGVDMIFQLHLQPTGKPESIRFSLGLYFADESPELFPYAISIGCRFFNIPPGATDYTIERSYTLPVDATAVSVYPHAHYLAKHVHGWVTLPDGSKTTLIEIKDWDFNWQDQYTFAEPLTLPAGTKISLRYVYDNTAANPRNPNQPPQRILYGPRSRNEMGELMLQLVVSSYEDFKLLDADDGAAQLRGLVSDHEQTVAIDPENVIALHELGSLHNLNGETERAAEYFTREIELREDGPDKAKALMYLAVTLHQRGLAEEAERALRQATEMEPRLARAWFALGDLLSGHGRLTEAAKKYERGLQRDPKNVKVLTKLGMLLLQQKQVPQAMATYRQILEINPDDFDARFNLANLLLIQRQADKAIEHYQAAIRLRPEVAQAHKQLGIGYATLHEFDKAGVAFERALALDDSLADGHYNLAMIREQQGRHADAARHYRRRLAAPTSSITAAVKLAWILATSPDESVRAPSEAVRLAEQGAEATGRQEPIVLDRLAAAYAAAGDFGRAVTTAEQAHQMAVTREQADLAGQIAARLQLYRQEQSYRQPASK